MKQLHTRHNQSMKHTFVFSDKKTGNQTFEHDTLALALRQAEQYLGGGDVPRQYAALERGEGVRLRNGSVITITRPGRK